MGKRKNSRRKQWNAQQMRERAKAVARAYDGLQQLQEDFALLYSFAMDAVKSGDYERAIGLQKAAAQWSADARKRVRTILNIRPEPIWYHTETCPMILGIMVDSGGCVGIITEIGPHNVRVEGTYFYSDGGSGGLAEHWSLYYKRSELIHCRYREWGFDNKDGMHRVWDASKLEYSHYEYEDERLNSA